MLDQSDPIHRELVDTWTRGSKPSIVLASTGTFYRVVMEHSLVYNTSIPRFEEMSTKVPTTQINQDVLLYPTTLSEEAREVLRKIMPDMTSIPFQPFSSAMTNDGSLPRQEPQSEEQQISNISPTNEQQTPTKTEGKKKSKKPLNDEEDFAATN